MRVMRRLGLAVAVGVVAGGSPLPGPADAQEGSTHLPATSVPALPAPAPNAPAPNAPAPNAPAPNPHWAVDPAQPGPDLPPAGRSLFDFVATREHQGQTLYDVPFPFDALLRRIRERADCTKQDDCIRAVLIPLGRSLQRMTAAPDFFRHPRIVAAVDAEGGRNAAVLLKDRLYLGYQERSDLIEVISYNEAAGRFEFQVVHDYRADATPRVRYARREVCASCHQNLAPIFSRQVWQETNANPRIAAALESYGEDFFGIPVRRGVDVPNAIDAATDRANLLAVWQRLWREGCGADDVAGRRCRAAAVQAALQYRLSGERAFDQNAASWHEVFLPAFAREWHTRWPSGLAVPNPDLPNRDPLPSKDAATHSGAALAHVPARFEALTPRLPLEIWTSSAPGSASAVPADTQAQARRFVAGLAGFLAENDLQALDRHLDAQATRDRVAGRIYEAECALVRTESYLRFRCDGSPASDSARLAGRLALRAGRVTGGELDTLAVAETPPLHRLAVAAGALSADRVLVEPRTRGLRARLADGTVAKTIELRWDPNAVRPRTGGYEVPARAVVGVIDDFAPVRAALAALAAETDDASPLAARPFRRARLIAALFARLGVPDREQCCDEASHLPAPLVESPTPAAPTHGPAQAFAAFYPLCAGCHATSERSPPNFLADSGERVAASMRHCAPRLYARLAMWRRDPALREKTPMPPPLALPYPATPTPPKALDALEQAAADLLRAETGSAPQLDALLAGGYEALRPCLPEAG